MSQMEIDRFSHRSARCPQQTTAWRCSPTPRQRRSKSGPSEFATLLSKGIDPVNQTEQRATAVVRRLSSAATRAWSCRR